MRRGGAQHGVDRATRRGLAEPLVLFAAILTVYVAATPQTSQAYRHFVYMAEAFLDGRVDLRGVPDYYHDLVHVGGRVYAPFPPVPALVLMPVVAIWGERADQGRVGQIVAAAAVAVFLAALRRMGIPPPVRWFAAVALGLGSVLWPATAIGTSWFFAQTVVVLAAAVLVRTLADEADPVVAGLAVTAAWLTRLNLLAIAPVVALTLWHRRRAAAALALFLGINVLGAAVYLTYNALRFGDPLQTGYPLLAMATVNAEAAARYGFYDLHFVPQHLYTMLLRAPELIDRFPYLKPEPWGMALIFTSPYVVRLAFPQPCRRSWLLWIALIASLALPMLAYFSIGWVQFGYRYSLDWWPFALVLLAFALGDRPRAVDYALLAAAVAMNALGVYWVRALGW